MEWLKNFITSNPIKSLLIPTSISGFTFLANLITAASDGTIDSNEMHQLLTGVNGAQTVVLGLVCLLLKKPQNK